MGLPGTWVSPSGKLRLTFAEGGKANVALYSDQEAPIWQLDLAWLQDGMTIAVGMAGAWSMRGAARIVDGQLDWLGSVWTRPTEPTPN